MSLEGIFWEEVPFAGTPKKFRKIIPIYEIISQFVLKDDFESLNVIRAFGLNFGEILNIDYQGREYIERLRIKGGKIFDAETLRVDLMQELPEFNLPEEEFFNKFQEFLSKTKARQKPATYHNIKRLESRFIELPWQDDFSAIYNGNSIVDLPP